MVGAFFRVDHDNKRSFWGDGDKVRMRHCVTLTARGVNFVRGEGNCAIEFANGVNDHGGFYRSETGYQFRQAFASSLAGAFR